MSRQLSPTLRRRELLAADLDFAPLSHAPFDHAWRHESPLRAPHTSTIVDASVADEIFADYADELCGEDLRDQQQEASASTIAPAATNRFYFDDVLRQAIAADDYAPLG